MIPVPPGVSAAHRNGRGYDAVRAGTTHAVSDHLTAVTGLVQVAERVGQVDHDSIDRERDDGRLIVMPA